MQEDKVWPPAPTEAHRTDGSGVARGGGSSRPYLTVILVMWAVTIAQFLLQLVFGAGFLTQLLGLVGFVLAVYLITRPTRAARVNGGLRLCLMVLGILVHLLLTR